MTEDYITHNQQLAAIAQIEQTLHRVVAERTALYAERDALRAQVTALQAALAPFAAIAGGLRAEWGDAYMLSVMKARLHVGTLDVGDVRRAAAGGGTDA